MFCGRQMSTCERQVRAYVRASNDGITIAVAPRAMNGCESFITIHYACENILLGGHRFMSTKAMYLIPKIAAQFSFVSK